MQDAELEEGSKLPGGILFCLGKLYRDAIFPGVQNSL